MFYICFYIIIENLRKTYFLAYSTRTMIFSKISVADKLSQDQSEKKIKQSWSVNSFYSIYVEQKDSRRLTRQWLVTYSQGMSVNIFENLYNKQQFLFTNIQVCMQMLLCIKQWCRGGFFLGTYKSHISPTDQRKMTFIINFKSQCKRLCSCILLTLHHYFHQTIGWSKITLLFWFFKPKGGQIYCLYLSLETSTSICSIIIILLSGIDCLESFYHYQILKAND